MLRCIFHTFLSDKCTTTSRDLFYIFSQFCVIKTELFVAFFQFPLRLLRKTRDFANIDDIYYKVS